MRLYLAAPNQLQHVMRDYADLLVKAGHFVTASWLRDDMSQPCTREIAVQDLLDIDSSDAIVVYNPIPYYDKGTGGRHTELGYALARGKRIFLLGQRSQIFHWLPEVRECVDVRDLISRLALVGAYDD